MSARLFYWSFQGYKISGREQRGEEKRENRGREESGDRKATHGHVVTELSQGA
jgi:hypothetical protein